MLQDAFYYAWGQLKGLRPAFFSKTPHFNFITAHYFWIMGLAILGSVLIYSNGNLAYIDALFFASGGSTQAGLNTVDVNLLTTFQQCVLYFLAMLANPITINSFVVFLRLYWFEKRFQHIVRESGGRRFTITKSKSKVVNDASTAELGVNGRHITVMHEDGKKHVANDGTLLDPHYSMRQRRRSTNSMTPRPGRRASETGAALAYSPTRDETIRLPQGHSIQIKFADTVKRSDGMENDALKEPTKHADEDHIAIVERQRNSDNGETLRIPGPRDAERGMKPKRLEVGDVPEPDGPEEEEEEEEEHGGGAGDDDDNRSGSDDDSRRRVGRNGSQMGPSLRDDRRPIVEEDEEDENDSGSGNHNARRRSPSPTANDGSDGNDSSTPPMQAGAGAGARHQTITIEEPSRRKRDEPADDVEAVANTVSVLRIRKPKLFSKDSESKAHHHGHHQHQHQHRQRRASEDHVLFKTKSGRDRVLRPLERIRTALSREKDDVIPYLSWQPTLGRNSAFVGLTEEQREELGGIEYRSLKTLAVVLAGYYWGFSIFAILCLLPWILHNSRWGPVVDNAGVARTWWGFFTANSAFNDLGFTLTSDSMNSFNTAQFPLLIMSLLIIVGNTGFPIMLRIMIWVLSKVLPRGSGVWEELRFLLDHPRRCFTLLFPSAATWWLFWVLVALNGIDLIFFVILDLGSGPIGELPLNIRFLDGWFQATSTRTAGFSCVNLADLHPAVQTSYLIMMYISVFPIAISVRRTNVYEEKSLGVYHHEEDTGDGAEPSYVATHLRRQLSFDLWFIFLGYFIITISEGPRLQAGDPNFSMFAVLFDIVSAYGTVGLSLGYPGFNTSFCGQFGVIGKLVIIAMQIRGRHRGLPYGLDRAILLPSESLNAKEAADDDVRAARRNSMASTRTGGGGDGNNNAGFGSGDASGNNNNNNTGIFAGSGSGSSSGYRATSARGRGRSRSMDRINSNLLSQFLAPGPSIPQHRSPSRRSIRSARSGHVGSGGGAALLQVPTNATSAYHAHAYNPAAAPPPAAGHVRRANTEPITDDDDNADADDADVDEAGGPFDMSGRGSLGVGGSVGGSLSGAPPAGTGSGTATPRPIYARRAETLPAVPSNASEDGLN